jgi:hypothetical protein
MNRLVSLVLVPAVVFGSGPDTQRAIERGLNFIYRTATDSKNFTEYGPDYLWCLYSIASTSRDPALARRAMTMGRERAAVWRRENPGLPAHADADEIATLAFGAYAAEQLGFPNSRLKEDIRRAAPHYTAQDYLSFDPTREPPPSDVPETCRKCSHENPRGATVCRHCSAKLTMESRYGVWYDALITTYAGDLYGVTLGAPYSAVIRWLPAMRPYRGPEGGADREFYDIAYAITHVIYTLNHYSRYSLSPRDLPEEFAYLKENLKTPIADHDPESVGEFLDSLKSFGLQDDDTAIRAGTDYLLASQNPDGSWGDMAYKDIYGRYHPTWTAVDGLRDYKWKRRKIEIPGGR